MNQFKGTPGPWKLMPFSDSLRIDSQGSIVAFGANKDNLCMVCQGEDLMAKWEEERANAQLIAAAPELLEALQSLVIDYDEFRFKTHRHHHPQNPMMLKARKAIAKALGETK